MGEHNKSIEELLNDFGNLRIIEIVKQVNMQLEVTTGSIGSNNPYQNNYEHGEASNPFRDHMPNRVLLYIS